MLNDCERFALNVSVASWRPRPGGCNHGVVVGVDRRGDLTVTLMAAAAGKWKRLTATFRDYAGAPEVHARLDGMLDRLSRAVARPVIDTSRMGRDQACVS